jgi:hypothetical protein
MACPLLEIRAADSIRLEAGSVKTTIATSEIFGIDPDGAVRRLTVAIGAPVRAEDSAGWICRMALADVVRPVGVAGADSFLALAAAVARVRSEMLRLQSEGWIFARDRDGQGSFDARDWPPA